jgi:hypothetical protein
MGEESGFLAQERIIRVACAIGVSFGALSGGCGGGESTGTVFAADAAAEARAADSGSEPEAEPSVGDGGVDGRIDTGGDAWCEGPPCPAPVITPAGGPVSVATEVTIGTPGVDATIFYTTDGTIPTHVSKIYDGPIALVESETIRAIAFAACVCWDSAVASATYTVIAFDAGKD